MGTEDRVTEWGGLGAENQEESTVCEILWDHDRRLSFGEDQRKRTMCLEVECYGISQPPQGDNESMGRFRHLAEPLHRQQRRSGAVAGP